MIITVSDAINGGALAVGLFSLVWNLRLRSDNKRATNALRTEMNRAHIDCVAQIGRVAEDLATAERNAQSSLELLRDGRLAVPARSRALRMLRSGMSPETAASELGMARNEVSLLQKVAIALAPRS